MVNLTNARGWSSVNTGREPKVPTAELFERFKKGNSGSDSIGIGLAIVRQICDISHFTIEYQYTAGLPFDMAVSWIPRDACFKIASKSFAPFTSRCPANMQP